MLHKKLDFADRFNAVDIAAVWPASAQIAPVPIPDIQPEQDSQFTSPTPASENDSSRLAARS